MHTGRNNENRRAPDGPRVYGAVRTSLIGYGAAAYAYFHLGPGSGLAAQASGSWGTAPGLVLTGIVLQLFLIVARALIKRYVPDQAPATQYTIVLEVIADGATVLLFAMATLGAISRTATDL